MHKNLKYITVFIEIGMGFCFPYFFGLIGLFYWFIISILFIKIALDYKRNQSLNELRIATNKDDLIKMTLFSIGIMIIIGLVIGFIFLKDFSFHLLLGSVFGILLIIYSQIKLPYGIIMVENSRINFFGKKESLDIDNIRRVMIYNNMVQFFDKNQNAIYNINELDLNDQDKNLLVTFFMNKLPLISEQIDTKDITWQTIKL